jgi:penicillin-binding protein 1B
MTPAAAEAGRPTVGAAGKLLALTLLLTTAWWGIGAALPLGPPSGAGGVRVRLTAAGQQIADLPGLSHRDETWRPLADYPSSLVAAVLHVEDRRFYVHRGIDPLAILRAAWVNLCERGVRQGGSSITQQLARTRYLTRTRSWTRKLREAALALLLELRYTKPQILEAYLNTVYLGHDGDVAVHGFSAAARHFLRKELREVAPEESALLAMKVSLPNRDVSDGSVQTRVRRDAILRALVAQGAIDARTARTAMDRPVRLGAGQGPVRAPAFVDLAREELSRRLRLPAEGTVRVATSLDPPLQAEAERAVQAGVRRIEARARDATRGPIEGALVAMEPDTGRVLALVGGRDVARSAFNRATRARRQPGSLFKPLVYLAAFEAGSPGGSGSITPASRLSDAPLTIGDGDAAWTPRNLDRRHLGAVTVRRAIEESRNIPAVRLAQEVGLERVVVTARRLGIASPLQAVPSLALGTSEVTLLEITGAYAALANGGRRVAPTTLAGESPTAGAAFRVPPAPPERAVSPESAFLVTHLLRGVMRDGTGRASRRWGVAELAAGKTGTSDGLRDAWFVGYTRDLVVGVWVGRDDAGPLGLTGAQAALPIWAEVMAYAVRRSAPRPFAAPPGVVFASVERATGEPTSLWCGGGPSVEEAFRAGTEPHGGCAQRSVAGAAAGFLDWLRRLIP